MFSDALCGLAFKHSLKVTRSSCGLPSSTLLYLLVESFAVSDSIIGYLVLSQL